MQFLDGDRALVTLVADSTLKAGNGLAPPRLIDVDANGNWAVTPTAALPDGVNPISVTATDPAGHESAPTTVPVTVDITVPAAPVSSVQAFSRFSMVGEPAVP